jgi:hypothetical protein
MTCVTTLAFNVNVKASLADDPRLFYAQPVI